MTDRERYLIEYYKSITDLSNAIDKERAKITEKEKREKSMLRSIKTYIEQSIKTLDDVTPAKDNTNIALLRLNAEDLIRTIQEYIEI